MAERLSWLSAGSIAEEGLDGIIFGEAMPGF